MEDINSIKEIGVAFGNMAFELILKYTPSLVGAIVALVIGLWVIKWVLRLVNGQMDRSNVDSSLRPFLKSLVGTMLKLMLAISIMTMLGIEMTSFIAILASAGLAVGLALSGTLQNFAGGVMILLFKPFKVGDFIEAQGFKGTVKEIQIFVTILNSPENITTLIPNGGLANNSITNYSTRSTRRVDWTVGVAYGESIDVVRKVIEGLLDADGRLLDDPAPYVKVAELADSSVNFTVRGWVKSDDYWDVFFDMNENIYTAFQKEGISIPFPQLDVHIQNNQG